MPTPGENKFLSFAENAVVPQNLLSDEDYKNNIRRTTGFVAGEPADNALMNSILRSVTVAMKGLTDLIAKNGTDVSQNVQAEEIENGLYTVISNLIGTRVNEIVDPILADMQAQIDRYADSYHGVPIKGIIPIACTQDELNDFLTRYPSFKVCDGTNGTIDLRDKFIVSSGAKAAPHKQGGSRTCDNIKVEDTVLTVDQLPQHRHEVPGSGQAYLIEKWPFGAPIGAESYIGAGSEEGFRVYSSTTGKGRSHTHSLIDTTSLQNGVQNPDVAEGMMPPYYALIFVQKVAAY